MAADELTSPVVNFYEGAHILVTGGTGFMGRVLVEKLLRTCLGIQRMYLLIRIKKGKEPSQRIVEIFSDPVFSRLREEVPNFEKKVTLVAGDCGELGLGLSEEDQLLLKTNVTHVFHGAATVRFDEKLKTAFHINIRGVREMLLLCKEIPNLKSLVHISTAYCQCPLPELKEVFYDTPITGENALRLLDTMSDDRLDEITPSLIKPWPNTYSFAKCISEDLLQKMGKDLPIAVVRPSIVVAANKEPIPGWIDNVYGPTGVVAACAAGLLRTLRADKTKLADMVPVDMAINNMICAAWDVGTKTKVARLEKLTQNIDENSSTLSEEKENNTSIYNFVCTKKDAITWREFKAQMIISRFRVPPIRAIYFTTITMTKYHTLYTIMAFLFHMIPAYLIDAGLLITGHKPQLVKGYRKIHRFSEVIEYFATREWDFENIQTKRLWNKLTPLDQRLFHFDLTNFNWVEFFNKQCDGMRAYIFKDDVSTIPAAVRKMKIFACIHYTFLALFYGSLAYLLLSLIQTTWLPAS